MGLILNIKNFNSYCGRYSRKAKSETPEKIIGWNIYDTLIEKLPILALRNRNPDEEYWPLSWERNRNFPIAIDLALNSLKAWQAFRPEKSNKIINTLKKDLPQIILKFQKNMRKHRVKNAWDIIIKGKDHYIKILIIMSKTIGSISSYKNDQNPMLGSKILHHFFPELFPIWDTFWIKNTALRNEVLTPKNLKRWLPHDAIEKLNSYNEAATEYATYLALMFKDLNDTSDKEYKAIERAYIQHSEVDPQIIDWHFNDVAPLLFEVCLLGKHHDYIWKRG